MCFNRCNYKQNSCLKPCNYHKKCCNNVMQNSWTCRNNNHSCNCMNNSSICNSQNNTSACNTNTFPDNYLYGNAYTPNQKINQTFTPELGLEHGTIFPELVSPYSPGDSIEFIEYLKRGGI